MSFLLLDAHAIIHRAYHSIPKLSYSGQPLNAVYGFYSILASTIAQFKPSYLSVCFDAPGPKTRNSDYIAYRAKRPEPEEDLIRQFPVVHDSVVSADIPIYSISKYEADDLLATLVKQIRAKRPKTKIYIITGDKDLMQIVDRKVRLLMPQKGMSDPKIVSPHKVRQLLGVDPAQVVDLKALMGDSSDNYPGVPGIGPKTAVSLLSEYKTLDDVYENIEDIPKSAKFKLQNNRESAYLSQKLAKLIDDIDIQVDFRKSRLTGRKFSQIIDLCKSFNFRSLVPRFEKLSTRQSLQNQPSLF